MVTFLDSFILGVALTLPLGPVTLEILRRGIKLNFEEGIKTALGAFSAELTFFSLMYLGLSRLSEYSAINFILGFLGVGFLLFLGYANLKDYFSKSDPVSKSILEKNSYGVGYLITFLNPLNFFMWVGIIGSFFAQNKSLFVSSGVLGGIFLSLFAVALISKLGGKIIHRNRMKYISLLAGLFLIYYGLRLLYNLIF